MIPPPPPSLTSQEDPGHASRKASVRLVYAPAAPAAGPSSAAAAPAGGEISFARAILLTGASEFRLGDRVVSLDVRAPSRAHYHYFSMPCVI